MKGGLVTVEDLKSKKIQQFESENPEFVKNNLVKLFLSDPKMKSLYEEVIVNPNSENIEKIDVEFKKIYTNLRFIKHVSDTLFYNSINYDKRSRLLNSRFSLMLDASIKDGEDATYLDVLVNETHEDHNEVLEKGSLKEIVVNENLYNALNLLTENQLLVLNMAYVEMLSDTEIAKRLNKSQQVISKTHRKALIKLSEHLKRKGG